MLEINDPSDFQGTPPAEQFRAGERMSASKLNRLQFAERVRREKFSHPMAIAAIEPPEAVAGSAVIRMTVSGVSNTEGVSWDIFRATDSDGESHKIAKPFSLRPSINLTYIYGGETYQYQYHTPYRREINRLFGPPDDVLVTQFDEIIPFYAVGDFVYVVKLAPEHIGPINAPGGGGPVGGIEYADLNVAGRAWGAVDVLETPI